MKAGGDFCLQDASILACNLHANNKTKKDLRIYCITDAAPVPIELSYMTCLPMQYRWKGWWSKMNLFSPELESLRPFLYMDLDTAIIGDFEELIPRTEKSFVMLKDLWRPSRGASGILWVPKCCTRVKLLWESWMANTNAVMFNYRGDQEFICAKIFPGLFFQDYTNVVTSFKPNKIWLKDKPKDKSIVCFHGHPRPRQAAATVKWVRDYFKNSEI